MLLLLAWVQSRNRASLQEPYPMRRCYPSILVIALGLLCSNLAVQGADIKAPFSGTEVAYLLEGSTVHTYDIDRASGNPTEQGSGVTIDSVSSTVFLPSSNDHFIYVTGYDSSNVEWLWVYATDSTGVPQLPAVQGLNLTDETSSTYNFVINKAGTLAYAAVSAYNRQYFLMAKIAKFRVDPNTGIVTKASKPAATYTTNGPCLLSAEAFFNVYGFNPAGNTLYDAWTCWYPYGNDSDNYYERNVNPTTGTLGPENQFFSWLDQNAGQDDVNITPSELAYFSIPDSSSVGKNSVTFYSLSGQQPFSCTASMLEACGYGLWNFVDPEGKFDLIEVAPDLTDITKIDQADMKLVDTQNYVQGNFIGFAPDDALIYTQQANQSNPWIYPIYVFNANTGAVTYTGGAIWDWAAAGALIPALRR